jgi:hypothetical protein
MLLTSEDVQVTQMMVKLSLEIVEIAEVVFLWLKVIVDDLIRAYVDGASLQEQTRCLSALPNNLEDINKNIIQRISYEFQQESY